MPVYKRYGKKGISYQITYQFNGRRIRETIGKDYKLAQIVLGKRLTQIAEGKYLDKRKEEKIKFEDFADEYLRFHCKKNHKEDSLKNDQYMINILERYFSGRFLHEITPFEIEKFRGSLKVSPATVNRRIAFLKCMFNRAVEWEKIKTNPVAKIKQYKENNKRVRFLETEEIKRLLEASPERLKGILIVALNTGMRRGEILNLKWKDIDIKREIIYVRDTKSGEDRQLPINNEVKKIFIKIPKHHSSPYIFHNIYNRRYMDVRRAFVQAVETAGIKDFKFHDLRHTFASHLVMAGVVLKAVQELLGHKTIEMTLRYAHLSPKFNREAVKVLESATNPSQIQNKETSPNSLIPLTDSKQTTYKDVPVAQLDRAQVS